MVATLMRCLAVGQDEIVIRMLDEILLPSFEIEFNGEDKPLPAPSRRGRRGDDRR